MTDFAEQDGSPKEQLTMDGPAMQRILVCAWADRHALMGELVGNTATFGTSGAAILCRTASSVPMGGKNSGTGSVAAYEKAIITADYPCQKGSGPETVSGNLLSESLEPTLEFLTMPYTEYQWTSAADGPELTAEEAPVKPLPGLEYLLTRYNQSSIPTAVMSLCGTCNASAWTCKTPGLTGITFPAQTLLFQPPTLSRTIQANGTFVWTVTYRLTFKPNYDEGGTARGWNWFWRASENKMSQIYKKGGGSALTLIPAASWSSI